MLSVSRGSVGPVALERLVEARAVGDEPVRGEDGEPRVLQGDEAHQHVVGAGHLLLVHARGLVAVMAVGDQQLGALELVLEGGDGLLVVHAPEPVHRAVLVGHLAPRLRVQVRLQRAPGRVAGVVVEAEDGGEVRARRAREAQPVLLRAGVRALVRADAARAVVLHAHAREDAVARAGLAVRAGVFLGERPQRGLVVADDDALVVPALEDLCRVAVDVAAAVLRQVDLDHVVRRAAHELGSLGRVDHVIGRSRDRLEAADPREVVVKSVERLDVGHLRPSLVSHRGAAAPRTPRFTA